MTVAEIKEYIDEVENRYLKAELMPIFTNANLEEIITNLKSMLDELENNTDNTTEWIKLTTHGMIRFQCKKCDSIFTLPWEHCPKCGRKVTNNIKTNVHKYNYETGKLEELK